MTAAAGAAVDALAAFRLDGQVAIVTGASSGLGERFARVLAGAGARVVVAARRADRLEVLAAGLPGAVVVPCDVSDAAQRSALITTALAVTGRVDILVNNAGVARSLPSEQETDGAFARVVDVNLGGLFGLCRDAAGHMLERGAGSIINVASVLGVSGGTIERPLAAYVASKGGVIALTRQLGIEWASRGVRVNALAPGYFRSEMTAGMLDEPDGIGLVVTRTPMARLGAPEELDGALLLLASRAGSYITGQTICVDGGWSSQ